MSVHAHKVCFFGAQGSGKGTQATRLHRFLGIPHLAPGDIFRKAISEETDLGKTVANIINAGRLVPDEITNSLMRDRLAQADAINGFILDGYPRDHVQADALDAMTSLTHVLVIDISDAESLKRISVRRVCHSCGHTTTLVADTDNQPCPTCGGILVHRDDDQPAAVRHRLNIYHHQTKPLLARYEQRGILHHIDGNGTIDAVWQRVSSLFSNVRID